MNSSSWHLLAIPFVCTMISGCIGVSVLTTTECESSVPICDYIYEKVAWGPNPRQQGSEPSPEPNYLLSKEEFISNWGEPTETIVLSDNEVTLVYKNPDVWCGVFAVWGLWPAPFIAPACESFDRITFKGNRATYLHFKRENKTALIFGAIMNANTPKTCPKPCPTQPENSTTDTKD